MDQQLLNKIREHGFIEAVDVSIADIAITQEVRNACEQNSCGQIGKNHMCPPLMSAILTVIIGRGFKNMKRGSFFAGLPPENPSRLSAHDGIWQRLSSGVSEA